jgi:hypothetical protein
MADLRGVTDAGYPGSLPWSTYEYCKLDRLVLLSVDPAPRSLCRASVQDRGCDDGQPETWKVLPFGLTRGPKEAVRVAKHTIKANIGYLKTFFLSV